ncbi:hypothetical protein B5G52_11170 [Pseudoalteromonas sp. A601]|nr:hypothetical protein B5G52_11170 [Pseudoalteromonas sp. A601]
MLPASYIEVLNRLKSKGPIVEQISSESLEFNFDILRDLDKRGYIQGTYTPSSTCNFYTNVSITEYGHAKLSELATISQPCEELVTWTIDRRLVIFGLLISLLGIFIKLFSD